MRVGLGLLRLSPGAFWAMTPIEFERAIGALAPRPGAPRRDDLGALMRIFPDHASPNYASKETGFG
jgi:uncharacterized phage protein (TIGR02216 family)